MTTQSTNFMGGSTKKHVFSEEPKENLKEYDLTWIVDLGNRNFRTYTFKSKDTIPTPEEKKYLIDLFEYMEAKIQNVQS